MDASRTTTFPRNRWSMLVVLDLDQLQPESRPLPLPNRSRPVASSPFLASPRSQYTPSLAMTSNQVAQASKRVHGAHMATPQVEDILTAHKIEDSYENPGVPLGAHDEREGVSNSDNFSRLASNPYGQPNQRNFRGNFKQYSFTWYASRDANEPLEYPPPIPDNVHVNDGTLFVHSSSSGDGSMKTWIRDQGSWKLIEQDTPYRFPHGTYIYSSSNGFPSWATPSSKRKRKCKIEGGRVGTGKRPRVE
ncbi:hypothetical protein BJ165DRAFT_1530815 [Panaeolus papilionaceus]|nr:hypothetical protein BJ165DRAFT_1530815 [Panaeolus papilionaceus]